MWNATSLSPKGGLEWIGIPDGIYAAPPLLGWLSLPPAPLSILVEGPTSALSQCAKLQAGHHI